MNDDGTITCLNSKRGERTEIGNRHPTKANGLFYRIKGCNQCEFMPYCKKYLKNQEDDERIFEVDEKLILYKQEAEKNLLFIKGIEMRVNRSTQDEGLME